MVSVGLVGLCGHNWFSRVERLVIIVRRRCRSSRLCHMLLGVSCLCSMCRSQGILRRRSLGVV